MASQNTYPIAHTFVGYARSIIVHNLNQFQTILSDQQTENLVKATLSRFPTASLFQGGIELGLEGLLRDILIDQLTDGMMQDLIPTINASHAIAVEEELCAFDNEEPQKEKEEKEPSTLQPVPPLEPQSTHEPPKEKEGVEPQQEPPKEKEGVEPPKEKEGVKQSTPQPTPQPTPPLEPQSTHEQEPQKKSQKVSDVPRKMTWIEKAEKEDAENAKSEEERKIEDAKRSLLKMRLPWAQRILAAEKTVEQLQQQVEEYENSVKKTSTEKPSTEKTLVKPKQEIDECKTTKPEIMMFGKSIDGKKGLQMFTAPPKKVGEHVAGWKIAGSSRESMFTEAEVRKHCHSVNKKPEKEATITSAKWFLCVLAILPKKCDYFLWDYDEEGIPYGWYQIANDQWMIHSKSQFVHTRHTDKPKEFPLGYWTHEECFQVTDKTTGQTIETRKPVSVAYLTYCLTPIPLRRGQCPMY